MADPTATITRNYVLDRQRLERIIKSSEALTVGGLLAHNFSLGHSEFADDANELAGIGVVVGQANGNNALLTGDGTATYKSVSRGGIILDNVSVTGVSAVTDAGKFIYATDGQTMTLTRPATGLPIGILTNWRATTYCDVYLFDFIDSVLLSLMRPPREIKSFGTFPTNAFQGTAAATIWTETAQDHYKFISLHALPVAHDNAAVAGAQSINLAIDTVDVTGGVLSLAYTSCDVYTDMGTAIDATAITALNEVHMGDVVILEMAASGTGFTADVAAAFHLYAIVEYLPGA